MQYYTYILSNASNTVLYVGVTNDISRRMYEHKNGLLEGFTKRYHVHKLVYLQTFGTPREAILREKQLKRWTRDKKMALITQTNPHWEEIEITL